MRSSSLLAALAAALPFTLAQADSDDANCEVEYLSKLTNTTSLVSNRVADLSQLSTQCRLLPRARRRPHTPPLLRR